MSRGRLLLRLAAVAAIGLAVVGMIAMSTRDADSGGFTQPALGVADVVVRSTSTSDARPPTRTDNPSACLSSIRRVTHGRDGFGYVKPGPDDAVVVGFVGQPPREAVAVIRNWQRKGCVAGVVTVVYSQSELRQAVRVASKNPAVYAVAPDQNNAGVVVTTSDLRLLRSNHPIQLLGVNVATVLQTGPATAD